MKAWLYSINQLLRLEIALAALSYAGGTHTEMYVIACCIAFTSLGAFCVAGVVNDMEREAAKKGDDK